MKSYTVWLFVSLCLASFTFHIIFRFIHVSSGISTLFFLCLDNSLLYEYTTVLLISSSVDGYLDCFHFLAFMSNAAVNICVQIFVLTCFQGV